MTVRLTALLAASCLAAACGGEGYQEETPDPEVTAMATPDPALEQVRADYVTHFNMHHASVVGEMFSDSAVFLAADGSVDMGRAGIVAGLEQNMAASPTLDLTTNETFVMGDYAIARGQYSVSMAPEGASPMSTAGHYMTFFQRHDGAWKIEAVVTNYSAPPPEGLPPARGPDGPPPSEDGTLTDLLGGYAQHFNLGHADMVADFYTEDAISVGDNQAPAEGRAAIAAALTTALAEGSPQLTIHDIATTETPDGWAIDGGWYELKTTTADGEQATTGAYMILARRGDDGTWKIHRLISNSQLVPAS